MEAKWIALSNTSIGIFMAFANANMILIALSAIFKGINFNPFSPSGIIYLMWVLMIYSIVTSVIVLTFGKLSDMFGRVKLYTLGFIIFTIGSILLSIINSTGTTAALELIVFRAIQGIGGGFMMVNSAAILTDYFPRNELGRALGTNQIAGLIGGIAGLILGGILAGINWRLIFIVNIPIGIAGTIWSVLSLEEIGSKKKTNLDIAGNITFISALTILLISLTYGLLPYDGSPLGWGNPWVWLGVGFSFALIGAFIYIEFKIPSPLLELRLFKHRDFATGNFANMLASLSRQGITFMLILWLQAIWLPLHGYSWESVPFWAGIYLIPNLAGFAVFGPISGYLSDRYGSKLFTVLGLLVSAASFGALSFLPYNFNYIEFAIITFLMGAGMGLFSSPNTADIMASVTPDKRGVASGIRTTLMNVASTISLALYFTIVLTGMSNMYPIYMTKELTALGIPSTVIKFIASLPATATLFASFLGYDPLSLASKMLPQTLFKEVDNPSIFVNAIAPSFIYGLREAIYISVIILIVATVISAVRTGEKRATRLGDDPKRDKSI